MEVLITLLLMMLGTGIAIILLVAFVIAAIYWSIILIDSLYNKAKTSVQNSISEHERNKEYTIEESMKKGVIKRID